MEMWDRENTETTLKDRYRIAGYTNVFVGCSFSLFLWLTQELRKFQPIKIDYNACVYHTAHKAWLLAITSRS